MSDKDSDDNYTEDAEDGVFDADILRILDAITKDDDPVSSDTPTDPDTCKHCSSEELVTEHGYVFCRSCARFNGQVLDRNPEWTHYEDGKGDGGARCGVQTNYFLPNLSLSTNIVGHGHYRLKKMHSWNQIPYKERSLSHVMQDIEGKCVKDRISKPVIENAKYLYKKITEIRHQEGLNKGKNVIIRGKNRRAIIAACVFYGALMQDSPCSPKDVADIFNLEMTQMSKGISHFEKLLEDEPRVKDIRCSDPSKFIKSYYNKLGLEKDYVTVALQISKNVAKLDLTSNHQPISIAAGIVLIISEVHGLNITKKHIAEVFKISEVTINKIYKKLVQMKNIIIDDDLTENLHQMLLSDEPPALDKLQLEEEPEPEPKKASTKKKASKKKKVVV